MLRALFAALALSIVTPQAAKANLVFEASLGAGGMVKPETEFLPITLMVAPGYTLIQDMLRVELGFVADLPAVQEHDFDFSLRPMLVIDPPVLPIYGRAIFAATNLMDGDVVYAYGAAVGIGFDLVGLGAFVEAGVVPQITNSTLQWIVEGRAGAYFIF